MPSRDAWLDNIKWVLITCVVIGHSWSFLLDFDEPATHAYDFLYFWHMPAFVLLSGYLSRRFVWDRRHFDVLIATLLVPYLIFNPLLIWFREWIGNPGEQGTMWIDPAWGMWYLVALFAWRLATPILKRHWIAIPISIGISLWAGTLETTVLSIPRILGMLPFFVVGLHLNRHTLGWLRRRWAMIPALLFLGWLWTFAADLDDWARSWFLLWNAGYTEMDWSPVSDAMRIRLTVMAIAFAGIFAVLALVPRGKHFFTSLGRQTMIVYLFHLFVVQAISQFDPWIDFARDHVEAATVLAAAFAIALALFLASPPVVTVLTPLADPLGSMRRWGWIPPEPPKSQPAQQPSSDGSDTEQERSDDKVGVGQGASAPEDQENGGR